MITWWTSRASRELEQVYPITFVSSAADAACVEPGPGLRHYWDPGTERERPAQRSGPATWTPPGGHPPHLHQICQEDFYPDISSALHCSSLVIVLNEKLFLVRVRIPIIIVSVIRWLSLYHCSPHLVARHLREPRGDAAQREERQQRLPGSLTERWGAGPGARKKQETVAETGRRAGEDVTWVTWHRGHGGQRPDVSQRLTCWARISWLVRGPVWAGDGKPSLADEFRVTGSCSDPPAPAHYCSHAACPGPGQRNWGTRTG